MAQDLYEEDDGDGTPDAAAEESLPAAGDVAPAPAAPGAAPLHPMVQDLLNQRMAQLKAAQDQAKTNQSNVGIGQALAQLAHGVSGAQGPADTSAFSAMEKNANAPVNNLVQQQNVETKALADVKSQAAQDPSSPASQTFRKSILGIAPSIAKEYGDPNDPNSAFNQITAADAPNIMKTAELQASIASRNQIASYRADSLNIQRQAASGTKQSTADQKEISALGDDLDTSKGRAGNFGKAGALLMAGDRVRAILDQYPDGNIPKSQTNELATATAAMIGGGSIQSQHQLDSIVPASLKGDANGIIGWLTNQPQGLEQQSFIKALSDSASREQAVARSQIDTIRAQRISKHMALAQRNPTAFNAQLRSAGLDPTNYDQVTGQYSIPKQQAGQVPQSDFPPDVTKYAADHGITPQQAAAIKAQRTAGP